MSIDQLTTVVTPPAHPFETGSSDDLARIQAELGTTLPSDYIELANTYGTGGFVDPDSTYIEVFNPYSAAYFGWLRAFQDISRKLRAHGIDEPYRIFPEQPGLLPWGKDVDGSTLYWLVDGRADAWPILACASGEEYYERFEMAVTTFLAGCFSGTLICYIWKNPPAFVGPNPVRFERNRSLGGP